MNIFFGCHEIANFLTLYSEAFKSLGHNTKTFVFSKNQYYLNNNYDIVVEEIYQKYFGFLADTSFNERFYRRFKIWFSKRYLKRIVNDTDIFIFMWSSLLPDNEDLEFIKKNGKKIVFINCGTDVRHSDPFIQEYNIDSELWKKDFPFDPLDKKLNYLRNMELYADLILSVPDQSGLALKPYFHLKMPFDANKLQYVPLTRTIPHVVHCPTRRFIKGSDLIESTLDRLKLEGIEFHYKKVVNVPNNELLQILMNSDVVVDELLLPGPGVLGVEAMASGCVECTRHIPNIPAGWIPPVVSIDSLNIYDELKRILTNRKLREDIAEESRNYVLNNHDPKVIGMEILIWLEGNTKPHYFPRFYLDKYIPQEQKISDYLKEKSLQVLRKEGCHSSTDLISSISRGLLPSTDSDLKIKRWV